MLGLSSQAFNLSNALKDKSSVTPNFWMLFQQNLIFAKSWYVDWDLVKREHRQIRLTRSSIHLTHDVSSDFLTRSRSQGKYDYCSFHFSSFVEKQISY